VPEVEVVVAHSERATLRVGDVFLKVDADPARTEREVAAMAVAPIPTPDVLWRKPPVLALAPLRGTALGRLGEPSTASSAAGPPRVRPHARCTTRRCRRGPVRASTRSLRTSTTSASDVIQGWWSLRSLRAARWLIEHGFDPSEPGCEFAVLRSNADF